MREEVRPGRREGIGSRKRRARGEGPTQGCGGTRARAERTENMEPMFVTLDVSKLSGWLNRYAPCRVERRAHATREEVRPGRREGFGWRRRKRRERECSDSIKAGGGRARAERTANMPYMVVTLEVSQLEMSALNAVANCRVERDGHAIREEVRPGRRECVRWRRRNRRARGGPDSRL